MKDYYVYVLVSPSTYKPLYVGKGRNKRAFAHRNKRPHRVVFIEQNLTEEKAYAIEFETIRKIGLDTLLNKKRGKGRDGRPKNRRPKLCPKINPNCVLCREKCKQPGYITIISCYTHKTHP